jgi:hypothetical protein
MKEMNNEWHYSPDGRKPPLIRFHSVSSAYEEQVASLLPQHDSDHPDSTTRVRKMVPHLIQSTRILVFVCYSFIISINFV